MLKLPFQINIEELLSPLFSIKIERGKDGKEEIGCSPMTKALIPSENKNSQETAQRRLKNFVTQRLRTDLGRSIGVITAIQLVWLKR